MGGHQGNSGPAPIAGKFRLCERIGESAWSEMYRAERIADFPQTVAIKLPRPGADIGVAIARLSEEQRALAPLHHPGIGALVDACLDAPSPWLAVEFIDGQPLDLYCARHSVGVRQKIEMAREVLSALAHAHQRLVIHGDLSFAHVLVEQDGHPHLIGFSRPQEHTAACESEHRGLRFLSPEQLSGQPLTTAADVYSTGAILALLLTGQHGDEERCDDPQQRDATIAPAAVEPPSSRCAGPLRRQLRGDLDAILLRALQPVPAARYASVTAFAEDLGNYLGGLPVEARRGGSWYRLRKFAGRNRLVAAAAAALALILLISGVVVALQAVRASRARVQAETRLGDMERLTNSLLGEISNDLSTLPNSAPVEEMLLRRTGDTLDQLTQQEGDSPAFDEELAREYLQLGELYARLPGDGKQAATAANKGIAILEAARNKNMQSPQALDLKARLLRLRAHP